MQELLLETLETHTDDMEILPEHKQQPDRAPSDVVKKPDRKTVF